MPVRPLGNEKCPLCSATFFLFFSCLQNLRLTPWKVSEVSFEHDSFGPQKFWSSRAWRSPVSLPQSDAIKLRGLVGQSKWQMSKLPPSIMRESRHAVPFLDEAKSLKQHAEVQVDIKALDFSWEVEERNDRSWFWKKSIPNLRVHRRVPHKIAIWGMYPPYLDKPKKNKYLRIFFQNHSYYQFIMSVFCRVVGAKRQVFRSQDSLMSRIHQQAQSGLGLCRWIARVAHVHFSLTCLFAGENVACTGQILIEVTKAMCPTIASSVHPSLPEFDTVKVATKLNLSLAWPYPVGAVNVELSNTQVFCFCSAHAFVQFCAYTGTSNSFRMCFMCFGIVRSSASGEKRDSGTKVKAALCRRFFGNRLNRYSKSVYPKIHTTPLFPKMEISTCRSEVNATGSDLFLCDSILGINNLCLSSLVDVISLSCLSRSKTQPVTKKDFS